MDYKEQAELNKALSAEWNKCSCIYKIGGMKPEEFFLLNATAITDLLARAEASEALVEELRDDFTDFVTNGVHNAAPYCANQRDECVTGYGFCKGTSDVCRGFVPRAMRGQEGAIKCQK